MEGIEFCSHPEDSKFRLKGKKVFLTYPRCAIEPSEAIGTLTELTIKSNLLKYVIVQELHKDGTPHLHALLEFEKVFETRNSMYFDLGDYHGNYCTVKNYPAAVRYLQKSGQPLANWDYVTYLKTQTRKGNLAVDYTEKNTIAIEKGPLELVHNGMIPIDRLPNWIKGLQEYKNLSARPETVDHFTLKLPLTYNPDTFTTRDIDLTDPARRHYWFYGPTGTGKTWCAEHQDVSTYVISKNNDWVGYSGQQLLILNEFKGELTPTQLIDIMESRQQNIKGSSAALPKGLLLVVTSNYPMRECYKNLNEAKDPQLDALGRRFDQTYFSTPHPDGQQGDKFTFLDATALLKDTTPTIIPKTRRPNPDIEMNQVNLSSFTPTLNNK